ncbi:unnamed protein product [Schistocephalus solidus]|uniref:Kynureninase n=1 Tax=Schistocephalus solidus TaxID=70667 RepID=A0A183SS15_SCHSO|nr:unnamed protein product [Schistocephalus solidus]
MAIGDVGDSSSAAGLEELARKLDACDPLRCFRDKFKLPDREYVLRTLSTTRTEDGKIDPKQEIIYLCSNSLGLQPKRTREDLLEVLDDWGGLGVMSHTTGKRPTEGSDEEPRRLLAEYIVGAMPDEVAVMESLTANIHTLLAAFYRPTAEKNCVLIEKSAFPSDYYAVESQITHNGYNPRDNLIEIELRPNDYLSTEQINEVIRQNAHRLAMIWLPGIHYFTGQLLDIKTITEAGHRLAKCPVGWDLAHAVGNVPLKLHDWGVDCAVWCTYKYLCGSPGGVAGIFVHSRHHAEEGSYVPVRGAPGQVVRGPRLTGWWGHRMSTRFQMSNCMEAERGAAAFQRSCPSMLLNSALRSSLLIFKEVGGMSPIREKSIKLTDFLKTLLTQGEFALPKNVLKIITPLDKAQRGAQLSLQFSVDVDKVYSQLTKNGVICDVRHPNCIRMAPAPLYTSFEDVLKAVKAIQEAVLNLLKQE